MVDNVNLFYPEHINMGFNLPRMPNPLAEALKSIGSTVAKSANDDRENKAIGMAFQKINDPNASSLDILQHISGLNVSDEKKEFLSQGLKLRGEEMAAKRKEIMEQLETAQKRNKSVDTAARLGFPNPQDFADLSPAEIVAQYKALNPQGGATTKPLTPEIQSSIDAVLRDNAKANPEQLERAFIKANVPKAHYTGLVESRRDASAAREKTSSERANKYIEETDALASSLPLRDASLLSMEDAIVTDDLSFFSPNGFAEATGSEWARDAAGGQYKAGAKTFFISNVQKFGARPNMYVEQQVSDMLPKIGRSRAGNLAGIQMFKFERDMDKEKVRYTRELEEKYENETGVIPGKIVRDVESHMAKYAADRQKQFADTLKTIQKYEKDIDAMKKGYVFMLDKDGSPLYVPQDEVQFAIENGGRPL